MVLYKEQMVQRPLHYAVIDEVASVNTRDALCDDRADAEIHGIDRRVLTARSLAVVLSADDDALSHRPRALRKFGIVTVIAVF